MSFLIGTVRIDGKLVLGPMAGITDLPFRALCKEQGADLVYTEMISAKGIYYNNKNTDALMDIEESEHPISLQLFGEDPVIMSEMAKRIEDREYDILDINMGCPVPKVVNCGEGSALMANPKRIGEIVSAIVRATSKPVTVKIRKGFKSDEVNAVEVARITEACGAAAVAVHGRTREQYYSGQADWSIIKAVKEAVSIPVIGNGDVMTPQDAKSLLHETGCDAIMIGRGALGNPWIFAQIKEYMNSGIILPKPELSEVIAMILRHTDDLIGYKGEYAAVHEMRKHIAWYMVGYPHSAHLRSIVNTIEDRESLIALLREYQESVHKGINPFV